MAQSEPSIINQLQPYRPTCPRCRNPTVLVGLEPAPEPDHDLRTFECTACRNAEVLKVKFR